MATHSGRVAACCGLAALLTAAAPQLNAQPLSESNASTAPIGQISIDDGAPSTIYAFSFGAEQLLGDGGGGGSGTGKAVLQDVSVVKAADALSTSLLENLVTGRHLRRVRVDLYASPADHVASTSELDDIVIVASTFELEDVVITGFKITGGTAESVAFGYRVVRLTTGGATVCWDVAEHRSC